MSQQLPQNFPQLLAWNSGEEEEPPPEDDYEGPLDIQAGAVVAFSSARALSAAKRGSAVYTIREDDGDTTQSFISDAITGLVSPAAITAFLNGANGSIALWNDQSGNDRDGVQATANLQPTWLATGLASLPVLSFIRGDATALATSGNVALPNSAVTVFAVFIPTDPTDTFQQVLSVGDSDTGPFMGLAFAPNSAPFAPNISFGLDDAGFSNGQDGSGDVPAVDTLMLIEIATEIATDGVMLLNGTQVAEGDFVYGTGICAVTSHLMIGDSSGGAPFGGKISEILIYPTKLSAENRTAIRQNIADFYEITLEEPPEPDFLVLDFVNETYTLLGEPVSLGDILVEDLEIWGPWDPDTVIVEGTGLVGANDGARPGFSGDLLTAALTGMTILFECTSPAGGGYIDYSVSDEAELDPFAFVVATADRIAVNNEADQALGFFLTGINKVAATITPDKSAGARNGIALVSDGSLQLTAQDIASMYIGDGTVLTKMTVFFPPVEDDALLALTELTYVPQGVHFGADVWLSAADNSGTDSKNLLISFWVLFANAQSGDDLPFLTSGASEDPLLVYSTSTDTLSALIPSETTAAAATAPVSAAAWHHVLYVQDADTTVIYVDDAEVATIVTPPSGDDNPLGGTSLTIGGGLVFDIADFQFTTNDISSYLVAGEVALARRRLFISSTGLPIRPHLASPNIPQGFTIVLSADTGDADSFKDFLNNDLGLGDTFVWTGTPTLSSTNPGE